MEIAWIGRSDKRFLAVLVIVPCGLRGQIVPDVNRKAGDGLVVVVLERAEGLQTVELGSLPTYTRDAVSDLGRYPSKRFQQYRAHAVVSLIRVDAIGEEIVFVRLGVAVRVATARIRHNGKRSIGIVKTNERVLLVIAVIVGKVDCEPLARGKICRQAVVAIVSTVLGQCILIRSLPKIHAPTQYRPGPRRVVGLNTISCFFARADAHDNVVVVGMFPVEVESQVGCRLYPESSQGGVFADNN